METEGLEAVSRGHFRGLLLWKLYHRGRGWVGRGFFYRWDRWNGDVVRGTQRKGTS